MQGSCLGGATGFSKGLRIGCPRGGDALPGTSNRFVKREPSFNADYRGSVTCLYDTQLLGACLHASECGGRSRPEALRGMPEVPIAPPQPPGPRRGGRLSALSAQPLSTGGSSKPLARRVDPVSRIVLEGSLPLP